MSADKDFLLLHEKDIFTECFIVFVHNFLIMFDSFSSTAK